MRCRLAVCLVLTICGATHGQVVGTQPRAKRLPAPAGLLERLDAFLVARQDPFTGLLQSYVAHPGLTDPLFVTYLGNRPSFTYDNALAAIAWMSRHRPVDDLRARAVLDGLLAIRYPDGTLPAAVSVDTAAVLDGTTSSGNQAWAMLAFLTGWEVLGDPAWLAAAEQLGATVIATRLNPVGFGGFTLFDMATAVSTEHNLDLYAAFTRLGNHLPASGMLTAAAALEAAERARLFAESRYDPVTGATWTGTTADGITTNLSPVPLDAQSWSVLSLRRAKWVTGIDWLRQPAPLGLWTNSSACPLPGPTIGARVAGPAYSSADTGDVWFEGLAQVQTVARLLGDIALDASITSTLETVQRRWSPGDGLGLPAACRPLGTGFGFQYFDALAVAPTAWAYLANRSTDPFWFTPLDAGLGSVAGAALPTVTLDVPAGLEYACDGGAYQPCRFTVTGTSAALDPGQQLYLLVEPTLPSAGGRLFTQLTPATVAPDGSWSVDGQLGDVLFPAQPGDEMRIVVLMTTTIPPAVFEAMDPITLDTVPGLVTVSGRLKATVR